MEVNQFTLLASLAKEIKSELKLKYTVMFFEENIKEDINILERILAKQLNPIIGKH